jgi:hypothetical protein
MSTIANITSRSIPQNAQLFVLDPKWNEDKTLYVRVDSRRAGCGYVYSYCAVTLSAEGVAIVDADSRFEDVWQEIVPA